MHFQEFVHICSYEIHLYLIFFETTIKKKTQSHKWLMFLLTSSCLFHIGLSPFSAAILNYFFFKLLLLTMFRKKRKIINSDTFFKQGGLN